MNLTKISLERNRVTILIMLMIVIMGLGAYNQLSRDSMPPVTIRVCTIVTQFPGASPERVEQLITDKIEKKIQEIPELKDVTSESRTGLSVVSVVLKDDVDKSALQPVWDKVRRDMQEITPELPSGIYGPIVKDDGLGVTYGIMLAVQGDGFSFKELKDYADDIKDDLIKLPEASRVVVQGIQPQQIYVEYDNARLAELGISATYISNIIASTNIVFSGGDVSLGDKRISLEPSGNFEDVEALENTLIPIGQNGDLIKLGDFTTITRGYQNPPTSMVKIDGEEGVTISIALKEGENLTKLGEIVDEKIIQYNNDLPVGISVRRAANQDYYVDSKVSNFLSNVLQSVGIVLIVMLLFLGYRTGLVVASLIPMVMIMTLLIMNILGIGLNQVSLAALIIALGLLVDNAIVMAESIMVKMEEGKSAKQSAIESSSELIIPLLISSLTTSASFLAFFLAESAMGEIMGPLFSVITIALLSSWVMAMTLVTMLAVAIIKVKKKQPGAKEKKTIFDRINVYYKKVLEVSLRRPFLFLVAIIGMFIGSLALFGQIPFIFFPDSDRNLVTVDMNLPLGTKIETTADYVQQIEDYMKANLVGGDNPAVENWTAFVGEGPESYDGGYQPGEANSGYAHMLINTTSEKSNQEVITALDNFCFEHLPDAETTIGLLSGGGGAAADVEVRVSGASPDELYAIADQIKSKMSTISFAKNIKDSWGPKLQKFVVDIDQDRAQRAGLTNQDIAQSLQSALSGFTIGSFREGETSIPIVSRRLGSQDLSVFDLEAMTIYAQQSGRNVPLAQVADIKPTWDFAKISRRNLFRTMTISCDVKDGFTATELTNELDPYLAEVSANWKSGYTYEMGGESESSAEAMGAVADNLPLAGFIILLLLMLQFNSFRKTFIVLSSIPLGLIGVILGLLIFRSYFGFMAFLGVIALAGIVINNAIVLIDRIEIEIAAGRTPADAIIEAAQQRFRPILLTTFTTTLGLIPLYLGGGLMWQPMAVSIMVGLLFATVITLLFVPVLYRLLYKVKY